MPRGFNNEEKQRIQKQLLQCGKQLFEQYGVRKTSIEDIARCAGIAKGSFYQFFPSKEILFFALIDQLQHITRVTINTSFTNLKVLSVENLTTVILSALRILQNEPLLNLLLNREEYQSILLKIPQEILNQERESDIDFSADLYRLWQEQGLHPQLELPVFTDLLRLLALSVLNQNLIETDFSKIARIMIKGILIQMFPEGLQ